MNFSATSGFSVMLKSSNALKFVDCQHVNFSALGYFLLMMVRNLILEPLQAEQNQTEMLSNLKWLVIGQLFLMSF